MEQSLRQAAQASSGRVSKRLQPGTTIAGASSSSRGEERAVCCSKACVSAPLAIDTEVEKL
eukprot:2523558-Amphidinium_carterae.1